MTAIALIQPPILAAASLAAASLLVMLERRRRGPLAVLPLVLAAPLAVAVAAAPRAELAWPALAVGLVIAVLARAREDALQTECALKMLWVMGASLALSLAGRTLLVIATGTPFEDEQWAVVALELAPPALWTAALPLSLLAGLVMLGGAPFHFWPADLFQGARPWFAPLAVAALQSLGAASLARQLHGIEGYRPAAEISDALLGSAALIAFMAGAATIVTQRRPERRVGTLASLNGALVLAALASARAGHAPRELDAGELAWWAAHLALALVGAGTLARFMPVSTGAPEPAAVLFRRHPVSGAMGLIAWFSLAGVPGTPGARLWLLAARTAAASGERWLLIALGLAWVAAFSVAMRQLHEAYGVRTESEAPSADVPWQARAALWISGGGILVWTMAGWLRE
jgi:NADH:ubiquinone oxidoreductase subunit 2 (subunit N)